MNIINVEPSGYLLLDGFLMFTMYVLEIVFHTESSIDRCSYSDVVVCMSIREEVSIKEVFNVELDL